ncbi:8990_t:CDS:2 [Cetraspora pellucida]|uniref:8990_t:CDS:1 n=1 Tax=Cetraspora pellucida TaxID=1433469 RepID=A0ACA9NBF3_9GLOM|nr:8990_t:CDS:2 [Cetraspora pellucida]
MGFKGDLKEFNISLKKRYGAICEVHFAGIEYHTIYHPEYVEKIFSSSIKNPTFSARTHQVQGLEELKVLDKGILFNNNLKRWKFNQLESYWQSIARNMTSRNITRGGACAWALAVDFSQWFHRYSYDIVQLPSELIENSNEFITEIRIYSLGVTIFMSISSFMRHYNPFIKNEAISLLKNRDTLFKRLDDVIKRRRKEIEEDPNNVK